MLLWIIAQLPDGYERLYYWRLFRGSNTKDKRSQKTDIEGRTMHCIEMLRTGFMESCCLTSIAAVHFSTRLLRSTPFLAAASFGLTRNIGRLVVAFWSSTKTAMPVCLSNTFSLKLANFHAQMIDAPSFARTFEICSYTRPCVCTFPSMNKSALERNDAVLSFVLLGLS